MLIMSDIHASPGAIMSWLRNKHWPDYMEKYCIQLGDFGFWFQNQTNEFEENSLNYIERQLKEQDKTLFTILGNHECWPRYLALPTCNDFSFKTWKIRDHIYAIQPGEIVELEGKTFLCLGGADSHDKEWREEYRQKNGMAVWWKEETISDSDMENAFNNLKLHENKVDYVLTHCAPATFMYKIGLYTNYIPSESEIKLDKILEIVDFERWYCGHIHYDIATGIGEKIISAIGIDMTVEI